MILCFPNIDTLRLVLTSGIVPTEIALAPGQFHATDDGTLFLETEGKISKKIAAELTKLNVRGAKSMPGEGRSIVSWLEVLPVQKKAGPPELASQTPVLFELSNSEDLPIIVGEMLRLGNDRQSYRWLESTGKTQPPRVLLRVIGPPYYTLLRAIDRVETESGSSIRAYIEQAPKAWVEIGYSHPLGSQIKVAEGQAVLLRAPQEWVFLDEAPFRDVYEILQFQLPQESVAWEKTEIAQKLVVPLKLAPGNAADAAELWVLRGDAIAQLDGFVREADERTIQRLKFSIATTLHGEKVVVLRLTPSKQPPPQIQFDSVLGFRSYWKIPNLFIPTGTRLHPQLRRDAVRNLLADDTDQLVWLFPKTAGEFTPETLAEDSFRPLEDWVDYIVETAREPLVEWVQKTTFDFEHFVCGETREAKEKKDSGPKDRKPDRAEKITPTTGPTRTGKPTDSSPSGPTNMEKPIVVEARPINEWKIRRDELQNEFLGNDGSLDSPERRVLWPKLAVANSGAGDNAEAGLCWVNAMWSEAEPTAEQVAGWAGFNSESETISAADFDRRTKPSGTEFTVGEMRRFASTLYALATKPKPPAWLQGRLPELQRFIETNENKLPVRAVWLVASRLAKLTGADLLGLARVRDRLLQRLLDGGLNAELDLPYFLRTAGMKDSSRVRVVKDQLAELHKLLRIWAEKGGKSTSAVTTTDNKVTLPYIDMMFAFAYAKLGEVTPARALMDNARHLMVHENPTQDLQITTNFLFKAFRYRVEQAIAGQPHTGPLDAALLAELDEIQKKGPTAAQGSNPFSYAHYAVMRMRDLSRILEPQEKLDPYSEWMKHGDDFKVALANLPKIKDPAQLARTIRELYKNGTNGKPTADQRFSLLHASLPLSVRVGEAFSIELLTLLPDVLRGVSSGNSGIGDLATLQGKILERALTLTGHYDLRELAQTIMKEFVAIVSAKPEDQRFTIVNVVAKESLRSLRKLGMRDEVDRLLGLFQQVVLQKLDLQQLRARHGSRADYWSKVMQAELSLATGWLTYDLTQKAEPILEEARNDLLGATGTKMQVKDFAPLLQAYIVALSQQDAEVGLPALSNMFRKLDPTRVLNGFTTAKFYSRHHLTIAEEVILAVVSDDFALGPAARRWLEEDEMLVRARVHKDMRAHLATSGL